MVFSDKYGNLYFANNSCWIDFDLYNNEKMESDYYRIVKVYDPKDKGPMSFTPTGRELLYDADPKKMTRKQIEEILGYKIEIID